MFLDPVTGHAILGCVSAEQGEVRLAVVKMVGRPVIRYVTIFAGLSGVVFFIDIPGMYIIVAIHTPFPDITETPFLLPFIQMTGKAGGSHVSPFQWKIRFIMVFQGIERNVEAFFGVAGGAIAWWSAGREEFPFVVVDVAGGTVVVG